MGVMQHRFKLGNAIRKAREENACSQATLAMMIGTSKAHIWKIETGRVGIGIDTLASIASAFGVNVRDLIEF